MIMSAPLKREKRRLAKRNKAAETSLRLAFL